MLCFLTDFFAAQSLLAASGHDRGGGHRRHRDGHPLLASERSARYMRVATIDFHGSPQMVALASTVGCWQEYELFHGSFSENAIPKTLDQRSGFGLPLAMALGLVLLMVGCFANWRARRRTAEPTSSAAVPHDSPLGKSVTPVIAARSTSYESSGPMPRLSRLAVAAAISAPFALFMAAAYLIAIPVQTQPGDQPPGPAWWQWLMIFTILPLGITSPSGTTILGGVAMTQIRHSAGRLYGLGLALFDALLFPIVVIDLVIWYGIAVVIREKLILSQTSPNVWLVEIMPLLIAAAVLIVLFDALLIYFGWRIAHATLPESSLSASRPQATSAPKT